MESENKLEGSVKTENTTCSFAKTSYEKPKYRLIKPIFKNAYNTTVSLGSKK